MLAPLSKRAKMIEVERGLRLSHRGLRASHSGHYSWWKTLGIRSCDSRTKSSLGLNCTTQRPYIHGELVLGIALLVPPTKTALLHLPPTLGVTLVASESVHNHMCEASIRGLHQSHQMSHRESEGSQNGRPHFISYPNAYSTSPSPRMYQTYA